MNAFAAIVPVAGLSSRMGSFKPLIKLNGFYLIALAVQSALEGGVQTVSVVIGARADEVKAALTSQDTARAPDASLKASSFLPAEALLFTHNDEYDTSDMLASIRLGLQALLTQKARQAPEAVFILPGDMPAVNPKTFVALQERWRQTRASVIVPCYKGEQGHPLLVSQECFTTVLPWGKAFPEQPAANSPGGLQEILKSFEWLELETDDPGILLDANTPPALAKLDAYVRKTRGQNAPQP